MLQQHSPHHISVWAAASNGIPHTHYVYRICVWVCVCVSGCVYVYVACVWVGGVCGLCVVCGVRCACVCVLCV